VQVRGQTIHVELDLTYENQSPVFWYMRDEAPITLAKNLSQEPWGAQFVQYCRKRSKNHAHYEQWGHLSGTIKVGDDAPRQYDFGTFRDHSWDLRLWPAIDQLFILLIALEKPLKLHEREYWFLNLTLVHMPGNSSGLQRFSSGYLAGKQAVGRGGMPALHLKGNLPLLHATSITDIGCQVRPDGSREPLSSTTVHMQMVPEPDWGSGPQKAPSLLRVDCTGEVRRMQYFPDHGRFEVFEDSMDFTVDGIKGYGTRQSGFRIGDYDPGEGGVG